MTTKLLIPNKYYDGNCYLTNVNGLFNLCDDENSHIYGYYLFFISKGGLFRDDDVNLTRISPSLDLDGDGNKLMIIGVDEI